MPKKLPIYLLAASLAVAASSAGAAGYSSTGTMKTGAANEAAASQKPVSYGTAIGEKLNVGLANVITSPVEIHKNIVNTTNEYNLALGLTGGALKGVLHMLGRTAGGIIDVLSFPLPTEPLTNPHFVWENYNVETRYNTPLLKMRNLK